MKIGVFDSGMGGLSVANAIKKSLPEHEILYREDSQNLPYGTKTPEHLLSLVAPILQNMADEGCDLIVVACNTVTTTLISELRQVLSIPLVGMEPMVKPASERTKTGTIAVFATPTTLGSNRYQWLKEEYCKNVAVIEPDCSDWALLIEENRLNEENIREDIDLALDGGADVLVLGCTHYHWIEGLINKIVDGKAEVIQPEQPVIEQIKRVLKQLD